VFFPQVMVAIRVMAIGLLRRIGEANIAAGTMAYSPGVPSLSSASSQKEMALPWRSGSSVDQFIFVIL